MWRALVRVAVLQISCDLAGVGVDPEIRDWVDFDMNGSKPSLAERMRVAELFTRNHVENMAFLSGVTPSSGFQTLDPTAVDSL